MDRRGFFSSLFGGGTGAAGAAASKAEHQAQQVDILTVDTPGYRIMLGVTKLGLLCVTRIPRSGGCASYHLLSEFTPQRPPEDFERKAKLHTWDGVNRKGG